MDAVISYMKVHAVDVNNGKPVIPFINGQIPRIELAKAPGRVRCRDLTVHVAFGVLTRLVIVPLHRAHLAAQEQPPGDINRAKYRPAKLMAVQYVEMPELYDALVANKLDTICTGLYNVLQLKLLHAI